MPIGLRTGDTQLSTRNARLRSPETRPHCESGQMYDLQTRSPSSIQWVSRSTRITWWSLHWWLQNGWESGAAVVINYHFQDGETTCRQLSKRLPDNSTIFAAEATAITLALNYCRHMAPVHHDVVVYSDSMSYLQAIEGEDTENPFICLIMNLIWLLSDTCSLLLDTKSLWHWGKWKSGPTSKRDSW